MSDVTNYLTEYRESGVMPPELVNLVYDELLQMARNRMAREGCEITLQPTALVHETYLRLFGKGPSNLKNRRHFFSAAAEVMRRVLVDQARRRKAAKRGGGLEKGVYSEWEIPAPAANRDIETLSEALTSLAARDPDAAELVRLRFFVGLTIKEAAETMGISTRTANRVWQYARAALLCDLR